jgi:tetratricopeptide (TPR) repeat protein
MMNAYALTKRTLSDNGYANRRRLTLCLALLLSFTAALSQDKDRIKTQEYLQQQEQIRKQRILHELDSGVLYMDEGKYLLADEKFRYVLANVKSVPSDLTYYFGKNSFYLERYQQSIDWLNKYIQLKGTNGQYSREALEWKQKAEVEFLKQKSQNAKKVQEVLSTDYNIDCGPTGKVTCPACKGDHVIIKRGAFGQEYKTCPYCNEHGILTCEEYNLMLRGELKPKR